MPNPLAANAMTIISTRAAVWAISLSALVACATVGCTSGSHSGQAANSNRASGMLSSSANQSRTDGLSSMGYRLEWSAFAVIPSKREVSFVETWDDILAVHGSGNSLTVLESSTGQQRWNSRLGGVLAKFVGMIRMPSGQIIDVAETELYMLNDQTGVLEQRQRLSVLANTAPVRYGGIMIVGSANGEVLGHNLRTGQRQWAYQMPAPIESDPIVLERSVVVLSDDGNILMLEAISGASIGTSNMYEGLTGNPVAGGGFIYCASRDQSLWAFPIAGGSSQWRVRTEHRLASQPMFHEGRVYITIPGEGLAGFNASTGERLWSITQASGDVVAIRNGNLVVWNGQRVTTVDPQRGELIASVSLDGASILKTDKFIDGNLYVVEPSGRIQKYSPR